MAGFMGDSSEGTFRKATGSVFPDCFIIGVSVQSSEGSQFSWKVGVTIIVVEGDMVVTISASQALSFAPRRGSLRGSIDGIRCEWVAL